MSKKVISIIKKNKNEIKKNNNEIFNLNEEIVIGINNKDIKSNNNDKKNIKNKKKSNKGKRNKIDNEKILNKKFSSKKKYFILFICLVIIFVGILLSPIFNINKITVVNNNFITKDEIISLSGIILGENTFKYINKNIEDNIKQNFYIENVQITRKYPSEIIIKVDERKITYCIKVFEQYAYIDDQGYIVDIADSNCNLPELMDVKTDVLNIVAGNRLMEEDLKTLEKINTIYNYAKINEIENKIIGFKEDDNKILIYLDKGKIAYIENMSNINIKILSLKVILERIQDKEGEIFLDGQGQEQSVVFREKV